MIAASRVARPHRRRIGRRSARQHPGAVLLGRLQTEAGTRGIPVVVVSTDPRLLERARAEWAGADARAYLAQPFDIDELLRTVGTLIGPA